MTVAGGQGDAGRGALYRRMAVLLQQKGGLEHQHEESEADGCFTEETFWRKRSPGVTGSLFRLRGGGLAGEESWILNWLLSGLCMFLPCT